LKRVLASWGDGLQMTVYLNDDVMKDGAMQVKAELEALGGVGEISYVPREIATENFKKQMASYAPNLLADADFSNPFPSSLRLTLDGGVSNSVDVERLEKMAANIQKIKGVEDVSYGQSWVQNYSSFVSTLYGSLFVVGNSIRTSISARREEIEILELVGATSSMIRRPFVTEGFLMGGMAAIFALVFNGLLHIWQTSVMSSSVVLSRLVPLMSFLNVATIVGFLLFGAALGALGAWLTVRRINDGWSAKQALENG